MRLMHLAVLLVAALPALAQVERDPRPLIAAQKEALAKLAFMDGVWRGPAWTLRAGGEKHHVTQTERIGPFLDGSVKLVEGRSYNPAGEVTFNALGVISYDPATNAYSMRSYALGHSGDFPLAVRDNGYMWEIAAGPVTIRYTATIAGNSFIERGERLMAGREPVQVFEMTLTRLGNTSWPAADPIPAK